MNTKVDTSISKEISILKSDTGNLRESIESLKNSYYDNNLDGWEIELTLKRLKTVEFEILWLEKSLK